MFQAKPFMLFTLHYGENEFRIKHSVLARTPHEVAALVGGQYVERPGGICEVSTDKDELGLCGIVRFPPEIFREMNETDHDLAGLFYGEVCYTKGGLGLLARRGEAVDLVLRRQLITVPDYVPCGY